MKPTAIVLHGPTSSGKTSLAKALQKIAPSPAFHVALDSFVTMSRRRDMRSDEEQRQAFAIHCDNLRSALARLSETQFEIIVDLPLRDEIELQGVLRVLDGRPLYLIGVRAPLEVLEKREHERGDRRIGMAREQSAHPTFDRAYDLVVDTSEHRPESGALAIREFLQNQ